MSLQAAIVGAAFMVVVGFVGVVLVWAILRLRYLEQTIMADDPDDILRAFYRQLSNAELLRVRWAFEGDRLTAKDRTFCDRRIALIDQELTARNTTLRI